MKKLFVTAFIAVMFSVNAFAKGGAPIVVTSGSLAFIKAGGTATVVYDYSNLKVAGVPLNDYLALKDDKFRSDWEYVIVPSVETLFAAHISGTLNKGNFTASTGGDVQTDYNMVLKLTELDLGNVSGVFNPFAGVKGGGAIISGTIEFVDNKTGKIICVVNFNKVKGINGISDKDRWTSAYFYLARGMQKIVKKSK